MKGILITLIIICTCFVVFSICYHFFLKCGHDWEVVDKLEKDVVTIEQNYSYDPTITKTYHKHILLLKCKKCGKLIEKELV